MQYIGSNQVEGKYLGETEINKQYLGDTLVWEKDNTGWGFNFHFNYNAKEYDSTTHTFPKKNGQLFNQDLVLVNAPKSYAGYYVDFGNNTAKTSAAWFGYNWDSASSNPFNRNYLNRGLTFIFKTSGYTQDKDR